MLYADDCVKYGTKAVEIFMSVLDGVIQVLAAFIWVKYVLAIQLDVEYGIKAVEIWLST